MDLTGRDNIDLAGAFLGIPQDQMDALTPGIIEFADIGAFMDAPVKTYSSGMRARLGFSIATAITPDILLLDEVLGTGDQVFRARSQARVRELVGKARAIVLVTHDLTFVTEFCNRAILVERGQLIHEGEPAEIVALYRDRVVKQKLLAEADAQRFVTAPESRRRRLRAAADGRTLGLTGYLVTTNLAACLDTRPRHHPSDRRRPSRRGRARCADRVRGRRLCGDLHRGHRATGRGLPALPVPALRHEARPVHRHGPPRLRADASRLRRSGSRAARAEDGPACDVLERMGHAYMDLLSDRDLLRVQLQAYAACGDEDVRTAVREEFTRLHATVRDESGASPEELHHFFAEGMLLNVAAALELGGSPEAWTLDRLLDDADRQPGGAA